MSSDSPKSWCNKFTKYEKHGKYLLYCNVHRAKLVNIIIFRVVFSKNANFTVKPQIHYMISGLKKPLQ